IVVLPETVQRPENIELLEHRARRPVPREAIRDARLYIPRARNESVVGLKIWMDADDVVVEAEVASCLVEDRFPHRATRRHAANARRRLRGLELREVLAAEDDLRVGIDHSIRPPRADAFAVQRAGLRLLAEALAQPHDVDARVSRLADW